MKYIFLIFITVSSIYSKTVDVDIQAQFFESNEAKNITIFKGNVSMIKGEDTLVCDEITLKTTINPKTNKKEITSYIAIGNVSFTLKDDKQDLIGNGDKVTFDLEKQLYIITGNGYIEDKLSKKMITGESIYLNQKTGYTKIDGKKDKPVKFKFVIQENN